MNISFFITNDKSSSMFDGSLTVTCRSSIAQILGVTYEELVVEEHGLYTRLNEYTEGFPINVDAGSQLIAPQIHGISSRYSINDNLEVNCTSAVSHPPPYLEWLVNNKQVNLPPVIAPGNACSKCASSAADETPGIEGTYRRANLIFFFENLTHSQYPAISPREVVTKLQSNPVART